MPCIEQNMVRNKKNPLFLNTELTTYPLYHTGYDKFQLVDRFLDQSFKTTSLITLVISEYIRQLSGSTILPFNCNSYAKQLSIEFNTLLQVYAKSFPVDDLNILNYAIGNFTKAASEFHMRIDGIDKSKYKNKSNLKYSFNGLS